MQIQHNVTQLTDYADYFAGRIELDLWFTVRTVSTANAADNEYTQRAVAQWYFDCSGPIDANQQWQPGPNAESGGSPSFVEVLDGSPVPLSDGPPWPIYNVALAFQVWHQSPLP